MVMNPTGHFSSSVWGASSLVGRSSMAEPHYPRQPGQLTDDGTAVVIHAIQTALQWEGDYLSVADFHNGLCRGVIVTMAEPLA